MQQDPDMRRQAGGDRHPHLSRGEKVASRVARLIVREIVDSERRPGDALEAESQMLQRLGVSRGSLREGLRILETQGLIAIRPGPGGGPSVADRQLARVRPDGDAVLPGHARHDRGPGAGAAGDRAGDGADRRRARRFGARARTRRDRRRARSGAARRRMAGGHRSVSRDRVRDERQPAARTARRARSRRSTPTGYRDSCSPPPIATTSAPCTRRSRPRSAGGDAATAERLMHEHMERLARFFAARYPGLMDEVVDWR